MDIVKSVQETPSAPLPTAVIMIQTHHEFWPSPSSRGIPTRAGDDGGDNDADGDASSTTEHAVFGVSSVSEGHDSAPGDDRGRTIHLESDWTDANTELSRQTP